jgi:hypothetical protein
LAALSELVKLAEKREQGPSPAFGTAHTLLAFLVLGASKSVGRQALAVSSGVGEGSMRTILKKLRGAGLVEVDPAGVRLTDSGRRAHESVIRKLTPPLALQDSNLTVGKSQVAVLMGSSSGAVTNGIRQRDASIKEGADGATTYSFKGDRFSVPGGSTDCEKDFPSATWGVLRERLRPRNGDVIIVCGAEDQTTAKIGALSAALTLA